MNPIIAAAVPGILGGLAGLFSSGSQQAQSKEQFNKDLAFREKQRQDMLLQAEAERQQRQRENALEATQLDPLKQQRSRQLNALVSSLIGHSSLSRMDDPATGLNYDKDEIASFFTPQARANAEAGFNSNAHVASNGYYVPPQGVGYNNAPYQLHGIPNDLNKNIRPVPIQEGGATPAPAPASPSAPSPTTPSPVSQPAFWDGLRTINDPSVYNAPGRKRTLAEILRTGAQ